VRQRLGEREAPLMLCQGAAEHDLRNFVRAAVSSGIVSSRSSWWNINSPIRPSRKRSGNGTGSSSCQMPSITGAASPWVAWQVRRVRRSHYRPEEAGDLTVGEIRPLVVGEVAGFSHRGEVEVGEVVSEPVGPLNL
jgi:hypothetical protein